MGGRRKFRLSDMMPNSWFYMLRDMRRARGRSGGAGGGTSVTHQQPSSSRGAKMSAQHAASPRPGIVPLQHRTSYYYTTKDRELQPLPSPQTSAATVDHHQLAPQTQSSSWSSRRRHRVGPVGVATGRELAPVASPHRRRDMYVGRDGGVDVGKLRKPSANAPWKDSFSGKVIASDMEIIFDLRAEDMPERVLRPIVTRSARREADRYEKKERHVVDHAAMTPRASSASEQGSRGNSRRSSVSSGRRLKTRANSPRLACTCRKGKPTTPATTPAASPRETTTAPPPPAPPLAESFAVVKTSADPRRDFRESMEEMIAENGIREAGDLEDLLACYLALNAVEHHELIVEVFEEIWTSLASVINP